MPARDEDRPVRGKARRMAWRSKRPWMGNRDAVVFVQFALPAIVEQAECRVAVLLNFGQHDAGADGVDGAGRNVDDVAFGNRSPLNEFGNRTVLDRCTQLLRRYLVLQSSADLRVGLGGEDVPCLALAVRHPHRARESVVRMNLDRQWLAGEQQLEQQGRGGRILVGPLEPQLADGVTGPSMLLQGCRSPTPQGL